MVPVWLAELRRQKQHKPRIKRRTGPGSHSRNRACRPRFASIGRPPDGLRPDRLSWKHTDHQLTDLESHLSQFPVCWINVDGLGDANLIRDLGERFQLHPLALEDVVNVHQRAKVEPYEDYLFVVARIVELRSDVSIRADQHVRGQQLRADVSRTSRGIALIPIRERVRKNSGRIRNSGTDYLMYAIVDTIIDSYFPVVDSVADRLEELELSVTDQQMADAMSGIHDVRNELLLLRRYVRPHRDAVNELIRDEHPLIQAEHASLSARCLRSHDAADRPAGNLPRNVRRFARVLSVSGQQPHE